MTIYYYRFNTRPKAKEALDELNASLAFPIVGRNARTKKRRPNKAKTAVWTRKIEQHEDGKFGFRMPPKRMFNTLGIPKRNIKENEGTEEERELKVGFEDKRGPTIEIQKKEWYPEIDVDTGLAIEKTVEGFRS